MLFLAFKRYILHTVNHTLQYNFTHKEQESILMGAMTVRKRTLLKALNESHGVVSTACVISKVSRKTYYNYMEKDPLFAAKANDVKPQVLDYVESKLFTNISANNQKAIEFYLKCKGKERGYVERTETHFGGQINLSITKKVIK